MNWLPYAIVLILGAIVGLAEIIATFSQAPREAFRTLWAWILTGANMVAAVGVFAIFNLYVKNVNPILLAVAVGVGFPTLIRTKFTVAKQFMGGEDLSINIGWLYDQFLGWFKSEIDISIVNTRLKIIDKLIKKIKEINELRQIAYTILHERSLLTQEDVERFKKYIDGIVESETIPKRAKQVALAKFIWNLGGRDYIKNLIRDQNGE